MRNCKIGTTYAYTNKNRSNKEQSMKRIALLAGIAFYVGGCYFPNQCGLSPFYYDEKYSFYDSQGMYHEVCPSSNVINYDQMRPRYGAHNPYVYDDFLTPVPADSPRGMQAQQRELEAWENRQADLAEGQKMHGGKNSAYPQGKAPFDDWMLGF